MMMMMMMICVTVCTAMHCSITERTCYIYDELLAHIHTSLLVITHQSSSLAITFLSLQLAGEDVVNEH